MPALPTPSAMLLLATTLAMPATLGAPEAPAPTGNIVVTGSPAPDLAQLPAGPDLAGTIIARTGTRIKVLGADGQTTIIAISEATRIKASSGLFAKGKATPGPEALLNGLPVTVRTVRAESGLIASQVTFKSGDLKTAMMIRNGTAQRFDEQGAEIDRNAAATEALKGRFGDITKYNLKSTTNVFFATGKAALSPQAKADLCTAATAAEATDNALMLVVGYTDSTGSDEYNQTLSERRAGAVINYLQQVCHWKPYRMLTPTGMAKADPLASNDTPAGKAQNRRVSVNILVSKGLDGM
ncbi:MAG: OmpA family protein [Proteobacteria bacterium]|nr:OmpA family protein [Pseudomonadota bacterium]